MPNTSDSLNELNDEQKKTLTRNKIMGIFSELYQNSCLVNSANRRVSIPRQNMNRIEYYCRGCCQ